MSDAFPPDDGRTVAPEAAPRPPASPARGIPPDPPYPAPTGRGVSRRLLAATLLLAAIISAAVWLDNRRTQQGLREEVAHRLDALDAAVQTTGKTQSQLASDLRDAQAKIGLLEARIAESQEQQASLEALYRDLAPSRDEIALTEIEQVLLLASQQLQLASNVPSALAALQLAEAKLQRLDRPQFLPLRRALARDIDRLKAVPFVDVAGLSVRLDQALASIDTLPLAMDERLPVEPSGAKVPPPDTSPWRRFARDVWADIRDLVRIEVADRPAAPLVPPPQQYFLRENLKLRLLSARIGLLNRDDVSFKADIHAADAWIRQYFDLRSKPVQSLQATLKLLAATPMGTELPDLARTLDAMRVLRAAADRAPARGAADRAPR